MKNSLTQLSLGLWVAMGVGMGIMSRSWEPVWTFSAVALFFGIGFWAHAMRKSSTEPTRARSIARGISISFNGLVIAVFLGGLLLAAERFYLGESSSYPSFLVSEDLGPVDEDGIYKLADNACRPRSGLTQIYQKEDGKAVIRCGWFWYEGKTFVATIVGRS